MHKGKVWCRFLRVIGFYSNGLVVQEDGAVDMEKRNTDSTMVSANYCLFVQEGTVLYFWGSGKDNGTSQCRNRRSVSKVLMPFHIKRSPHSKKTLALFSLAFSPQNHSRGDPRHNSLVSLSSYTWRSHSPQMIEGRWHTGFQ